MQQKINTHQENYNKLCTEIKTVKCGTTEYTNLYNNMLKECNIINKLSSELKDIQCKKGKDENPVLPTSEFDDGYVETGYPETESIGRQAQATQSQPSYGAECNNTNTCNQTSNNSYNGGQWKLINNQWQWEYSNTCNKTFYNSCNGGQWYNNNTSTNTYYWPAQGVDNSNEVEVIGVY